MNMLTKKKEIKHLAKLVRKQVLGKLSTHRDVPKDFIGDVESGLGVKVLYTDSDKYDSVCLFDTNLNRPVIILARKLNLHQRFFNVSLNVGCLCLFWNYQINNGLSQKAYDFLNKNKQMFDKNNYVLSISPDVDNPKHNRDVTTFAKYLLKN